VLRRDAEIGSEVLPADALVELPRSLEPPRVALRSRQSEHLVLPTSLEDIEGFGVPAKEDVQLRKTACQLLNVAKAQRKTGGRFEHLNPGDGGLT
jgi:hypothetical protein